MRALVFDSEGEARVAEDSISVRARELFSARGYQIDEQGCVIGKNAATGEDMPDQQRTERWAVPQQRADGKWIVPHPEQHTSADVVIDPNGTTVVQYVMQDCAGAVIEDVATDWFPHSEGGV